MDSRLYKTVFFIQYEHMKGSFVFSAKGQTKRTYTIIYAILPDTSLTASP